MISFTHHGRSHTLDPGIIWTGDSRTDTYRDTSANELWNIVREVESGKPWREVVRAQYEAQNPWLYRIVTDPARDLFIRQFPVPAKSLILDVGAGWGQYTLPLARENRVVAVEPTPERLAFIQAVARQDGVAENVYFLGADFLDLSFNQNFDHACCIGVLEWVPKFRAGDPWPLQCDFLRRIRAGLKPGGMLLLGIENRLGLKYLLSAPDDHIGCSSVAVYHAALAQEKYRAQTGLDLRSFTYTHAELGELLRAAGFSAASFFCAFPDYKVPTKILPFDERAETSMSVDELFVEEHDGSCGRRLDQQKELRSHYGSLAQMKIARFFAPSFFVTAIA